MSLNKIRNAFCNTIKTIKSGSIKEQYILVLCITVIVYGSLWLFHYLGILHSTKLFPGPYPDSPSYVDAGERFANGIIDAFRTPVYPIICYLSKELSSFYYVSTIYCFQIGVFFISIYFFLKLNQIFLQDRFLIFVSVLAYSLFPYYFRMNNTLLTESLSISLFVIYCYYLIDNINKVSYKRIFISFLLTLLLIFLRPSFIYIIPLSFIWYLYVFYKKRGKFVFFNMFFLIISILFYVAYCNAYENKYKVFTTSYVGYINQYEILRRHNLLDTSTITDKEKQNFINELTKGDGKLITIDRLWYEKKILMEKYGIDGYISLVKVSIKNNFKFVVYYAIGRFFILDSFYIDIIGHSYYLDIVVMYLIYIVLLVSLFLYFIWNRHHKKIPILSCAIWILLSSGLFVAVLGAQYDYFRLILPSIPFVILITFQLINYACSKKRKYMFNIV